MRLVRETIGDGRVADLFELEIELPAARGGGGDGVAVEEGETRAHVAWHSHIAADMVRKAPWFEFAVGPVADDEKEDATSAGPVMEEEAGPPLGDPETDDGPRFKNEPTLKRGAYQAPAVDGGDEGPVEPVPRQTTTLRDLIGMSPERKWFHAIHDLVEDPEGWQRKPSTSRKFNFYNRMTKSETEQDLAEQNEEARRRFGVSHVNG